MENPSAVLATPSAAADQLPPAPGMSTLVDSETDGSKNDHTPLFPHVTDLGEGLTPIDVWQAIHASVPVWIASAGAESGNTNRNRIDENDLSLMKALADFPADKWAMICEGTGWTSYGAVALSWCDGADLATVLDGWRKAMAGTSPDEDEMRPARFVNPALLNITSLTHVVEQGKDLTDAWLLLAACKSHNIPLKQDLPQDRFAALNPAIKALLSGNS